MAGHDLARELLATATSNLKALVNMQDSEAFDDWVFGFHAQQAVKKTLKAWLNVLQQSHPFTHDLSLLISSVEKLGVDVEPYWNFLELSSYAVQFRYECFPEEKVLDRTITLKYVKTLLSRVDTTLKA